MQRLLAHAGLVASRPMGRWRETLAILATYASGDFPALCDALARRLVRLKSPSHQHCVFNFERKPGVARAFRFGIGA